MADPVDVVIVGTRCAGASLGIHLARAGLRVVGVDRAEFPSDTPSTHFFQVEGILALQRLGVLDRLRETGAPILNDFAAAVEAAAFGGHWPLREGDLGGGMCIRRPVLDTVLVEAARDAGVDVRTRTILRGLLREDGRVVGVTVEGGADRATTDLRARLVVGADGRLSSVAKLVGARRYHETPSPRVFSWAYFDGAPAESPPRTHFYRRGDDFALGSPCDNGAFMLASSVSRERFETEFERDIEAMFEATVAAIPEAAALVAGATRDGRVHSVTRYDGFLRESAGPGWVLVGDAGHFKDPSPGQGISDALRQSEKLAPVIIDGLSGRSDLDAGLQDWWRWRDEDAFEKHWFASDLGRGGPVLTVEGEIIARLVSTPAGRDRFVDILNHRAKPSDVLTPGRLVGATARLLGRRGSPRRTVLRDASTLMGAELHRRRLRKRPVYSGGDPEGGGSD
jgi:2-polyprenyl-6-methoxyphenol hydroxylase-like FAD-dependent oxidoreductase